MILACNSYMDPRPEPTQPYLTLGTRLTTRYRVTGKSKPKIKHWAHPKMICVLCDSRDNLDNHRIVPGGSYTSDNVIVVCNSCHRRIHAKLGRRPFNMEPWDAILEVKAENKTKQ